MLSAAAAVTVCGFCHSTTGQLYCQPFCPLLFKFELFCSDFCLIFSLPLFLCPAARHYCFACAAAVTAFAVGHILQLFFQFFLFSFQTFTHFPFPFAPFPFLFLSCVCLDDHHQSRVFKRCVLSFSFSVLFAFIFPLLLSLGERGYSVTSVEMRCASQGKTS